MTKLIQLSLSKVKYAGDSIGDDIRIEIDCLNHSLDVNRQIKNGSEIVVNAPVGTFFTDQLQFSFPLSVKVIERDLLFNDVGTATRDFKIDVRNTTPQFLMVPIEVRELRNYHTKKTARFDLIFEAKVGDALAYVAFTNQGWFTGKYTTTNHIVDLVSHLQIRIERYGAERDYFQIVEGPLRGKRASLMREEKVVHFTSENPHTGPVRLVYSRSQKTLTFGEQVYKMKDYPTDPNPWRKGLHDIEIADYSHEPGRSYLNRAALALVWFKVSHPDGNRYLHVGAFSLGCMTLTEVERWDELCKILLKARKGDGRNIGTVEVVD